MSVRVHNLAKQLNMENKELMALLKEQFGYDVKSPSATVDNITAEAIVQKFAPPAAAATPPAVAPAEPSAAKPATPPSGFIKTTEDLDRERREREAVEAAAKAAARAAAAPPAHSAPPAPVSPSAPKMPPPPPRSVPPAPPKYPPFQSAPPVNRLPSTVPFTVRPGIGMPGPSSGVTVNRGPKSALPSATKPPVVPAAKASPPPPPAPVKNMPPSVAPNVSAAASSAGDVIEAIVIGPGGKTIQIKPPIIVRDFATMLGVKPFKLISELMEMNIFASMNQAVDEEVAVRLAKRHGCVLEIKHRGGQQPQPDKKEAPPPVDESKFLEPRAPIVCVLGHVNHGKTTLLDAFRKTNVVAGEAGGITQHTGAYQVEHKNHKITFLDTPGHAAFSKMRERGASLTDIAVLVVAADDGFMPQTDEALKFAQAAGVPIVVAINKMDSKGANIDRVKQAMQQRGITSEDWGGETLCEPVSALKGTNMDKLLDAILLQAEVLELKANPKCPAEGVIVDSQVETGRGATATVIVEKGTLKLGAALVCGQHWCKVRALVDDKGEPLKAVTPGMPARVLGWSDAPEAGAKFQAVKNEREAKALSEATERTTRHESLTDGAAPKVVDLNALLKAIHETKQKTFYCLIKGDVHGTVEALDACLKDIKSDKVKLEVVAAQVGPISQNDVIMASTSNAAIIGFNVKMENGVAAIAKHKGVRIIQHNIIYELINQVREAMVDLLDPELRENKIGAAEVRQVFPVAKGFAAGCMVTEGRVARTGHAKLMRAGQPVFTGRVDTLKRFKDDASEVRAGFECGIHIAGCETYQVGDIIESFEILQIKPTL